MSKPIKRKKTKQSHYPLSEVKDKVKNGKLLIKPNAEFRAYQDFAWSITDIKSALLKLSAKDFQKTEPSEKIPGVFLDFYKAYINKENVYTHFYINRITNTLIINSFHEQ